MSCGYNPQGKQIKKYTTWVPAPGMTAKQIEKELERQKVLFEEQVKSGQYISGDIRFSEFAEKWFLDYAEKQLKPRTIKRYREHLERINPIVGNIRMDRLQPSNIMDLYKTIAENPQDVRYKAKADIKALMKKKNLTREKLCSIAELSKGTVTNAYSGVNVSKTTAEKVAAALRHKVNTLFSPVEEKKELDPLTIRHYHEFLSSVLSTAVYWQVIPANPCQRVKPPKAVEKEARYLNEEELAQILRALEGEPLQYKTLIYILLYTGMRRGEAMGLEWKDIDMEEGTIEIKRTSAYIPGAGVYTDTTKNKSSIRQVSIDTGAIKMLKAYKIWQGTERLKLGSLWQNSDRLFIKWDGSPMHPDTPSAWFRDFLIRHDLPNICLHSLRHTHATMLIINDTDIRTVSGRLGHARTSTTMDIYSHMIRSADKEAAHTMDNLITASKKA